jgi:signal transduction histidine kinase
MNRERASTFWRRFLGVLAFAAAGLAAVVSALYLQDRRHERLLTEQEGEHLVRLQAETIAHEFEDVRADLLYLSDQRALREFLSGDQDARQPLEQDYVRLCLRKTIYDQVRCLDTSGKEVLRVNYHDGVAAIVPEAELQEKAGRYYFREAMELGQDEVLISPFDLNVEHGAIEKPLKPTIRFLTPVFDEAGARRGFVVLNYLGDQLLKKLAQASRLGRASLLLLNVRGDYLLAERPKDAWGWMLGHGRAFRVDYPQAWRQMENSPVGRLLTSEGLFTFRRLDYLRSDGIGAGAESFDPSLIVASRISVERAFARSSKLLNQLILVSGCALAVVAVVAWHGAKAAALHRAHEEQIADSELRLRKLSSQLLAAQEEERRSISRQLHDELGQLATAISLDLKSAARQADPEHGAELVRRAIDGADRLLKSLHEIASRVRPTVLDDLGLCDAVESFVEEFSRRTGIAVAADLKFERERIPAEASEHAYRILQEALTNVARHAQTDRVAVAVHVNARHIELSVRDEGVGFAPESYAGTGLGILGMQERAELLGGHWRFVSAPGRGTQIEASLPLSSG